MGLFWFRMIWNGFVTSLCEQIIHKRAHLQKSCHTEIFTQPLEVSKIMSLQNLYCQDIGFTMRNKIDYLPVSGYLMRVFASVDLRK